MNQDPNAPQPPQYGQGQPPQQHPPYGAASATWADAPISTPVWTDSAAAAIWPGTNYGDTGPSIVLSPILLFILLYTNCYD